jgi:hypothetical protein
MIPLVTLLVALLVDAGERTVPRLHEVRGRAGARDPDDGLSPVQKRLLWVLRSFPPEVSIRVVGVLEAARTERMEEPFYSVEYLAQRGRDARVVVLGRGSEPGATGLEDYVRCLAARIAGKNTAKLPYTSMAALARPDGGVEPAPYDLLPAAHPLYDLAPWVAKVASDRWRELNVPGAELRPPVLQCDVGETTADCIDRTMRTDMSKIPLWLPRISDWAHATSPDLMGLRLKQAKGRSDRWHARLVAESRAAGVPQGDVVHRFEDGWTVQDLPTKKHLLAEGAYLGHCVGRAGYWEKVEQGDIRIHSLRDSDGRPVITFEVKPVPQPPDGEILYEILQAKGFADRRPAHPAREGAADRRAPVPGEVEHVAEYVIRRGLLPSLADMNGTLWFATKHGFWEENPDALRTWVFDDAMFDDEWGEEIESLIQERGIHGLSYDFDMDDQLAMDLADDVEDEIVRQLRLRNGIPVDPEDPRGGRADWKAILQPATRRRLEQLEAEYEESEG